MRRWVGVGALALVVGTAFAADLSKPFSTQVRNAPESMSFSIQRACAPADAETCKRVILATGPIDADAAVKLEQVVATEQLPPGTTVVLDSAGGNLTGALKLGAAIREHGFNTRVAGGMNCFSGCVYAFLGGVARSIAPDARVGVHRFYGASGETGTLEQGQQVSAFLATYVEAMGAKASLMALAAQAGPDSIQLINTEQAQEFGLDNEHRSPARWILLPSDTGLDAVTEQDSLDNDRRAWLRIRKISGKAVAAIVFRDPGAVNPKLTEAETAVPHVLLMCRARGPRELAKLRGQRKCLVSRQVGVWKTQEQDPPLHLALFELNTAELLALVQGPDEEMVVVSVANPDWHAPAVTLLLSPAGFEQSIRAMLGPRSSP